MAVADLLGRPAEISGPPVVSQSGPEGKDFVLVAFGQILQRRIAFQEPLVVGNDGLHLSLLEHHLGQEDRIGLQAAAPGKIPPVPLVPAQQIPGENGDGNRKFQLFHENDD